jgi:template-activating factor I
LGPFYSAAVLADNTPQHFKENPYFKNKVLTKEYKLKKPWSGAQTDGIYDEMLDVSFDPSADLEPGTCKIEWKGEDKEYSYEVPQEGRS